MQLQKIFRSKKKMIKVGAVIIAAILCFTTGALWSNRSEASPVISSDLISQKLISVNELTTVNYIYTNMGKFEEQSDFYGWKVPLTKKGFIISYDGQIKAGIDMKQVKIDVTGKKIKVTLPKAKILSHVIDEKSVEVFDESTNIFKPIRITDYIQFSIDQKDTVEKEAVEKGLLAEAQNKAKDAVKEVFFMSGVDQDKFELVFKD